MIRRPPSSPLFPSPPLSGSSGPPPAVSAHLEQWLNLALRWAHVITGVAWIGTSFYFNWLNSRLAPPPPEQREPGVAGELWSVHGGGFYRVVKYAVAPTRLPPTLQIGRASCRERV